MNRFWRLVLLRVMVAWLSPSSVVLCILGWAIWLYVPQIASRGMTALDGANGALVTVNRPGSGILAHIDAAAGAASNTITAVGAVASQAKTTIADVGSAANTTITQAGNAIQSTSDSLNRPCRGPAGPDACGTLASVNKVAAKVGDTIVETQMEERGVLPHTTAAMDAWVTTAHDLDGFVEAPCLAGTKDCVPYMQQTSGNITKITGSWAELSSDAYDFEHPYVHPSPCKDFKCRLKRYGLNPALGALGISDDIYRGTMWGRALPVKVVP